MSDEEKLGLECGVCLDPYDTSDKRRVPKLLMCAHTFCLKCLDGLNVKTTIKCPTCRSVTSDINNTAKDLRNNFALIDVLPPRGPPIVKPKATCLQCSAAPCTMYCPDCDIEMCVSCMKTLHSFVHVKSHKPFKGHKPSGKAPQKCKHHDEKLKVFCHKEQVPICSLCHSFGAHKGHNAELLSEISAKRRKVLEEELSKIQSQSNNLRQINNKVSAGADTLSKNLEKAKHDIRKHFNALKKLLKERETTLIEQAVQDAKKKHKSLQIQRGDLAVCISKLKVEMQQSRNILAETDDITLMTEVGPQIKKMKSLLRKSRKQPEELSAGTGVAVQLGQELAENISIHGNICETDVIVKSENERKEDEDLPLLEPDSYQWPPIEEPIEEPMVEPMPDSYQWPPIEEPIEEPMVEPMVPIQDQRRPYQNQRRSYRDQRRPYRDQRRPYKAGWDSGEE